VGNKCYIEKPKVEIERVEGKRVYIYKEGIGNKIRRGD